LKDKERLFCSYSIDSIWFYQRTFYKEIL